MYDIGEQCKNRAASAEKEVLTSAPHGRGATPYTETVEYQDMIYWKIESLKVFMTHKAQDNKINQNIYHNLLGNLKYRSLRTVVQRAFHKNNLQ